MENTFGFMSFLVRNGSDLFSSECGGHRWQRIPPTENNGRVHTSTITVAVLPLVAISNLCIKDSDIEIITTKGSGPGGQNRNKVESCVVITYIPTGEKVRCATERSQYQNKQLAMQILASRIKQKQNQSMNTQENNLRRTQIGSGMRGDKIRTYREKDNIIIDHITNKKSRLSDFLCGKMDRR